MKKPVVHYDTFALFNIELGKPAIVFPVNHPSPLVSNQKFIRTSEVMYYSKGTGIFETQNTRYVPDYWVRVQPDVEGDGMGHGMVIVEDYV